MFVTTWEGHEKDEERARQPVLIPLVSFLCATYIYIQRAVSVESHPKELHIVAGEIQQLLLHLGLRILSILVEGLHVVAV